MTTENGAASQEHLIDQRRGLGDGYPFSCARRRPNSREGTGAVTPIPQAHKVFFAVILVAAGVVAAGGLLMPAVLADMFSWFTLPPLHARFLGAIYLWGALFMLGCLRASKTDEVQWALPLVSIFTGMLFVVSVMNLGAFDLGRTPALIWFASYSIYPLIGLGLFALSGRPAARDDRSLPLPSWARTYLLIQGVVVSALAILLLVVPAQAAGAWPWPVTTFLAQAYSGPLLAYGLASLLFSRLRTWPEVRSIVPGMLAFTAVTLIASVSHLGVFGAIDAIDLLWLAAFGAATTALAVMTVGTTRRP